MRSAGMVPFIDAVGNVRGRAYSIRGASAPAMFVGSHYDSVVDGGMFDGAMGIISGIAAVKALVLEAALTAGVVTAKQLTDAVADLETRHQAGKNDTLNIHSLLKPKTPMPKLLRPIEVVGFADEEGIRFSTTFLGSRALAGTLKSSGALESKDPDGHTISDALAIAGLDGSDDALAEATLSPGEAAGYVELHLEQGPVLEATGRSVGVVRGIAGQHRFAMSVRGEQGHAGTVPMKLRKDPMAGTAEIMSQVEKLCKDVAGKQGEGGDDSLVCTVGSVAVWPGAVNVIPGTVNFTLDVRSQSDEIRAGVLDALRKHVERICRRRELECTMEVRHQAAAVQCNPTLIDELASAVEETTELLLPRLGLTDDETNFIGPDGTEGVQCPGPEEGSGMLQSCANPEEFSLSTVRTATGAEIAALSSGAGHDAMAMVDIAPVGMLFVRCRGGVSHSPIEWVEPEDVATGTAALMQFLRTWERRAVDANETKVDLSNRTK